MCAAFQFASSGSFRRKYPRVESVLEFSHALLRGNERGRTSTIRDVASAVLLLRKIEQLAAHEIHRRLVVLLDVVERVGDDLGRPDEARLHVLQEEKLHGAEG